MRTNWDNWKEREAEDESGKVAAILLEERFELEREQQRQQFEHEMNSQRLWTAIGLLTLFLLMIAGFSYMQMKNTTKLRELNKSLVHHNEALEQFAHITSHDLKEPVRTISSFAGLLLKKSSVDKYDDDERKYLSFIESSAKSLHKLIVSIKRFTDVSFKKHKSEKVDAKEVFEIVYQNLGQLISEKNALVEFHNPQSIDIVHFPKELLILILQNLIQNGIKYNRSDCPKIGVTILEKNQETTFKVSDNGIGIEEEFQDQVFVPFKRLQNKQDSQSSGLGLSICKNILENHNGKLWLESDGNTGSSFYFSI